MPTARLTSKGQVTIPKEVRKAMGLRTGDRLAFRLHQDGTAVIKAEKVSLKSLRGAVRTEVKGVTVEAMNDAIRRAGGRE
jgi:antitoxin PrlF